VIPWFPAYCLQAHMLHAAWCCMLSRCGHVRDLATIRSFMLLCVACAGHVMTGTSNHRRRNRFGEGQERCVGMQQWGLCAQLAVPLSDFGAFWGAGMAKVDVSPLLYKHSRAARRCWQWITDLCLWS
jgi:hypothetical protein